MTIYFQLEIEDLRAIETYVSLIFRKKLPVYFLLKHYSQHVPTL